MKKIDYKKELKHLYQPSAKNVVMVNVPQMNFLMIDGKGDPNSSKAFRDAVESLYGLSYAIRICPSSVLRAKATGNGPL